MDENRLPKRILESSNIGKRPVGKSRKRWVNAVEIYNTEILNMRNWKREPADRQIWRPHVEEAKARLGLSHL
jgi:hypothetical protein